jgi:hypothetical protein
LFVFSFNRRQLHKQLFPNYQAHIKDFVYPWFSHSDAFLWTNVNQMRL